MIKWVNRLLLRAQQATMKPAPPVVEDFGDEDVFGSPEMFYLQASASEMAYKIRAAQKAEAEAAARQQGEPGSN